MSGENIESLIRDRLARLSPLRVALHDDSALHAGHAGARDGGGHFRLEIVAEGFRGQPTLARHRMVYDALGDLMRTRIHAMAIRAFAPEEV